MWELGNENEKKKKKGNMQPMEELSRQSEKQCWGLETGKSLVSPWNNKTDLTERGEWAKGGMKLRLQRRPEQNRQAL